MMKQVAAKAVKGHEKRLHGMAKGGGVEIKGKTKGKMIAMKKGGMGKSC
jgi:tartrate dehydratase alpha subunit/fumarate hydratase class I-like protein